LFSYVEIFRRAKILIIWRIMERKIKNIT